MIIREEDNLLSIIEKFKDLFFSEIEVNFSENTKKTYSRVLDELEEFVFCENSLEELKIKDFNKYLIMQFIQELQNRNLSKKTISLYLKVIKRFFKFISENNESGVDLLYPIEKLTIKEEQKEITTFTKNEIEKIKSWLLNYLDTSKNYDRYKNMLCIAFIAYTGIRADECLNIKKEDIDIEDDYIKIKIKGKGNKERFVYLDEVFIDYIEKLNNIKPKHYHNSIYLFSKKDGNKMSYRNIFNVNKRVLEKNFIYNKDKQGLHTYRHTLASILVDENINLETIKDILGHSSISTTSKYYAKAGEKAKRDALLKKI